MSNSKKPEYQTLANKPIACTFCGSHVQGQVFENVDPKTKQSEKLIKWNCARCGNRVRIGKMA